MNNNLSIKDTKIDSYCTPESLWCGGGETQGKKLSDLSGESCLTSITQLIVASKNEILIYFQRAACLLVC